MSASSGARREGGLSDESRARALGRSRGKCATPRKEAEGHIETQRYTERRMQQVEGGQMRIRFVKGSAK